MRTGLVGTVLIRRKAFQGVMRNKVGKLWGNRMLAREQEEFEICHYDPLLGDVSIAIASVERTWATFSKLQILMPFDSVIPLPDI